MKNTFVKPKIIIIPDVHGRKFWREVVRQYLDEEVIFVFLGDYLDPYDFEGISAKEAVENFKEIIEIARNHRNIHLLIGNHDCGYAFDTQINDSRTIYPFFYDLRTLFRKNSDLFNLAYSVHIGNVNFLLSHAGIDNRWLKKYAKFMEGETVVDKVNSVLKQKNDVIINLLGCTSRSRGGWTEFGSCVWQDIDDWTSPSGQYNGLPDTTQICGHTMQIEEINGQIVAGKPLYNAAGNVYCLDCQRCFFIDDEGNIREFETEEIVNQ